MREGIYIKPLTAITLLALLEGVGTVWATSLSPFTLISTDDWGVTVEYTPMPMVLEESDGEVLISLTPGDLYLQPNTPIIPFQILQVAIPPYSSPKVSILSWEEPQIISGRLKVYRPPADIQTLPTIKSALLEMPIGQPEVRTLGGIWVARIPITPVKWSSSGNMVEIAKKVRLRVEFNQTRPHHQPFKPAVITQHHRLLVINADQAQQWGRAKTSDFSSPQWPQGRIYRFALEQEGIYRVTFEELRRSGVELPSQGVPSNQLKLYGNGGFELPLEPQAYAPLGLLECALMVDDGGDGRWGPGDWFLFYGKGPGGWMSDENGDWRWVMNHYSTRNLYWLVVDPRGGGRRMEPLLSEGHPTRTLSSVMTASHQEPERFIYAGPGFPGSGQDWYAVSLDGPSQVGFTFNLSGLDTSSPAQLKGRIVSALFQVNPYIVLQFNQNTLLRFVPEAYYLTGQFSIQVPAPLLKEGANLLLIEQTSSGGARALVDYVTLFWPARLDRPRTFFSPYRQGVVEIRAQEVADPWFFEVTDHQAVKWSRGSSLSINTDIAPRRFILVSGNSFLTLPSRVVEYFPPPSDIPDLWAEHNRADVLLIVADDFYQEAGALVEHLRRRTPPLGGARVRIGEIYNRFSGGNKDPAAIRNMLHYAVEFWQGPPRFVILCGDGDYNYRDFNRPEQPHLIPPYEWGSLGSDDWFADFTPFDEDRVREPLPELVLGRLTAQSAQELQYMIEKIIAYDENPEFGLWRNRITLVADDEFGEISSTESEHVRGSEDLSARYIPSHLERIKIYLTDYPRQWGREKPQAGKDLVNAINRGTLIVNYMGHGNPTLWAHERVFVQSRDFPLIEPSRRQALYIAFTCDWAYFDDPTTQSFPEQLLSAPGRGAIAAIASNRLTYAFSNTQLARNYFSNQFQNPPLTIGEALWLGKVQTRGTNSATYHLLGDPTLHLGFPRLKGTFLSLQPYPLIPLTLSRVRGQALTQSGDPIRGDVIFLIRDSAIPRRYTINTGGQPPEGIVLSYNLNGAIVYQGLFSIEESLFEGSFIVPKEVTLGGNLGQAIAYYYDETRDGIIYKDSIQYSTTIAQVHDTIPPSIQIFFNHRGYREGEPISVHPLLIVDVSDSNGINLTGSMGHGIRATIDQEIELDLTPYFRYFRGSYQKGSVEYQIERLEPGHHLIEVEAWDAPGNLGVVKKEVEVVGRPGGLLVDKVLNWPNPFRSSTHLTFILSKPAKYEIRVFTIGGTLLWEYSGEAPEAGMIFEPVWDGRDLHGREVGNGVYIYKVIAIDDDGNRAEGLGRIARIR